MLSASVIQKTGWDLPLGYAFLPKTGSPWILIISVSSKIHREAHFPGNVEVLSVNSVQEQTGRIPERAQGPIISDLACTNFWHWLNTVNSHGASKEISSLKFREKHHQKNKINSNHIFLTYLLLRNANFFQCWDYTRIYTDKISGDFTCNNLSKSN